MASWQRNLPTSSSATKKGAAMEHIKKKDAIKHHSSSHCIVYDYSMQNREMNIATAEITGRYPDRGYVVNHNCHEMAYVLKGTGKLVTDIKEAFLSAGDVVYIAPGEKYYWEGKLTLVLPTSPAWTPDQHEIISEELLGKR